MTAEGKETTMRTFTPKSDALYFTDNGAIYCGDHLGSSARYTGRDISGQKIERVTPEDAAQARRSFGMTLKCETCGAAACPIHVVTAGR